jgi:hypothetical protein
MLMRVRPRIRGIHSRPAIGEYMSGLNDSQCRFCYGGLQKGPQNRPYLGPLSRGVVAKYIIDLRGVSNGFRVWGCSKRGLNRGLNRPIWDPILSRS